MPSLRVALGLRDRDVIALVGAGGKTTAMFRLARELRDGVVITTTTKILVPPPSDDLALVVSTDDRVIEREVAHVLRSRRIPVAARATSSDGKLEGIAPELVDTLGALPEARYVIVESDGAARRPFKAPREGEPVIPASTTLVIAVVGIDAIGAPLAEAAHRPERVTALTGLAAEDPLDAAAIAQVMVDPRGGAKDVPSGARFVVLINKADDDARLARARELERALRANGARHVVIAALDAREAVRAVSGG